MSSSALRGAVLVALAALLGYLILLGVADLGLTPVGQDSSTPAATPTLTADDSDSVTVAPEPTEVNVATARPNSEVAVLVANGTEVSGQAGRLTDALRNQGFNTRQPRSATLQPASFIYYRPGFAAEAQVVRTILNQQTPLAPMPEPDPTIGDDIDLVEIDVLVLIGADELSTG